MTKKENKNLKPYYKVDLILYGIMVLFIIILFVFFA